MFLSARPLLPLAWEGTRSLCQAAGRGTDQPAPSQPPSPCPGRWPLPATLAGCDRAPGALTTHPHRSPRLHPGLRPALLHPAPPPPLTPAAPELVPIPGPPHPPQPRTRDPAPDQLGQQLRSSDSTPEMPAAAAGPLHIPHPSLLFFKKAPGESSSPAGRGYNHASEPEPEPRSRRRHPAPARPPRRPASPAGVSPAERSGQGAPPTSPAVRPAGPGPASASGARGSAQPAGLGRERRQQHTGQPGASPRHPGPGARALPRSRGERLGGGARFRSARAPGARAAPLPPGPAGSGGTRGRRAASWQLRTDSWRPPGPGPGLELGPGPGVGEGPGAGAGGPCGGPGRAVLTAVGDEQAGQDHERPKS